MLFVFSGYNQKAITDNARRLVSSLQDKQPDAEVVSVNSDEEVNIEDQLQSLAADQGLFFSKSIVSIPRLFPDKDLEKVMKKLIAGLQESPSVFVWREPELNKGWITTLEKAGAKVALYGDKVESKKDFNVFTVAEALLATDRKRLWLSLKEAQANQVEAENVYGTMWWQLKTVIVAKQACTADEAKMKPYSYRKAESSRLTLEHARTLLSSLVLCQARAKQSGSAGLWLELETLSLEV